MVAQRPAVREQGWIGACQARLLVGVVRSGSCWNASGSTLGLIWRICESEDVDLLCVAFFTSASAATSSLLAPSWAGAGAEAGAGCAGAGALLAGAMSVFAGSGTVAGAGAGAVSVFAGSATGAALDGLSVVAVGLGCSSFLDFFLKRPLKAFFIWSIASGAGEQCVSKSVSRGMQ
jgi:hypothetical protein